MLNPINVKKYCRILTFLVLPVAVAGSQATRSAGDLHGEIQSIYNFQPHTLSAAQITQKSALLDQFWNKAKSQHGDYTAGLRRELADFSNPPFFFFDGSKLLMSLSSDPADRKSFSLPSPTLTCAMYNFETTSCSSTVWRRKEKTRPARHFTSSYSRSSKCSFRNTL